MERDRSLSDISIHEVDAEEEQLWRKGPVKEMGFKFFKKTDGYKKAKGEQQRKHTACADFTPGR